MTDAERAELARFYGFSSYQKLLAISTPLTKRPGDRFQCYVARGPKGKWFLWEERPVPKPKPAEPPPMHFLKPDDPP